MAEGAWIFLSHSHQDFNQVSRVRDFLEKQKHHPLMFFLKCLNDDDEIDGLIRREIEARSWFILCNSLNAQSSRWVQEEVQMIKGLPATTHTYAEIDLDDPGLDLDSGLFALTRKASVFLYFAPGDRALAARIRDELRRYDFGVFSDLEPPLQKVWLGRELDLESVVRRGAVLLLLSAESIRSNFWQQKTGLAFAAELARDYPGRTHILPVYFEDSGIFEMAPPILRQQLREIPGLKFSESRFTENMALLMTTLRQFPWRA